VRLKIDIMIRAVQLQDGPQLVEIYNHYIQNTIITFEEEPISAKAMTSRIEEVQSQFPWLVYDVDGQLLGYAYASAWRSRSAYRHSVETTVYLHKDQGGKGIGKMLYDRLLEQLKLRGLHAAIGGIALPNDSSVALHEKCGFEKVAQFKEVGFKFGQWIDVGYWQKIL
jgi:L-amino acid N-acyltransferase YncA